MQGANLIETQLEKYGFGFAMICCECKKVKSARSSQTLKKPEDYPLVSVIVLNYNGKEYLDACLKSVLRTDYPCFEVVFVDNGSKDASYEYVMQKFGSDGRIKLISIHENKGFAEGNNIGIQNAEGELITFLNNDTNVDKNWLKELVNGISQDSSIGVVQSKLLSYLEPDILDSAGGALDVFGNGRDIGRGEKDKGQYDENREILYACFAAAMVKREVLRKVGLLDPQLFAYYEDADFCWRARLSGYKIMYIPKSKVYHLRRGTTKKVSSLSLFHQRKNRLVILIVNSDLRNLLKALSMVLFGYSMGFFMGLFLTRNLSSNSTFVEAMLWNLRNLPYLFRKRSYVQNLARIQSIKITDFMYKGNFLIETLIKKRSFTTFVV
jgi:GT2 family glycosyltransferase